MMMNTKTRKKFNTNNTQSHQGQIFPHILSFLPSFTHTCGSILGGEMGNCICVNISELLEIEQI